MQFLITNYTSIKFDKKHREVSLNKITENVIVGTHMCICVHAQLFLPSALLLVSNANSPLIVFQKTIYRQLKNF
jgi:hypothetical protein